LLSKKERVPPIDKPWPDEYFDKHIETMDVEELKRIQWKKLKNILDYAYHYCPFYHKRFDEAGVKPDDIKTFKDFVRKIPKFTKDDLRKWTKETGDPYSGILGVPEKNLVYVCASTGTTGTPTYYAGDKYGCYELSEAFARSLWAARLRPWMKFSHVPLAFHWYVCIYTQALKLMGMKHIVGLAPWAHPIFAHQILDSLLRSKPDHMWLTPPPALAVLKAAEEKGIDIPKLVPNLMFMSTGGEAITYGVRKKFMEGFGLLDFFDTSLSGEGHYTTIECFMHDGCHVWMDKWFVELVDVETGEPIEEPTESDRGSIVITNLVNRGSIYIRCDTEDAGWIKTEKCACGRTHPRVEVVDRAIYIVKVSGKKFTPTDVREAVEKIPELSGGDFTIVQYASEMDVLKIKIAPTIPPKTKEEWDSLEERTKQVIKREIGVDAEIRWVKYEELPLIGWKIARLVKE